LTHAPAHSIVPAAHSPITHTLLWQISPPAHIVPQAPQLSELLDVSAHMVPHWT
jgi:hypothetical protein